MTATQAAGAAATRPEGLGGCECEKDRARAVLVRLIAPTPGALAALEVYERLLKT